MRSKSPISKHRVDVPFIVVDVLVITSADCPTDPLAKRIIHISCRRAAVNSRNAVFSVVGVSMVSVAIRLIVTNPTNFLETPFCGTWRASCPRCDIGVDMV